MSFTAIRHWPYWFGWLFFTTTLFANSIDGLVIDEKDIPLANIQVFLVYGNGFNVQTHTAKDGRFLFADIPKGEAICYVNLPVNYQSVYPNCGEHQIQVGVTGKTTYVYRLISKQGVIIDYGKPFRPTRPLPGGDIKPAAPFEGPDLRINSVTSLLPTLTNHDSPTVIESIGRWSLPNQPGITFTTNDIASDPSMVALDFEVRIEDLGGGLSKLRYEAHPGRFLEDGMIATFTMTTTSGVHIKPGPLHFCAEVTTVYAGNRLLWMSHHQVWQGEARLQPSLVRNQE